MAEAGGSKLLIDEYLTSIDAGSEFTFDYFCEVCKDDGKYVEAEGFCVDCGEYLCDLCYSGHKRNRYTCHHELLDKGQMPKDTPLSVDRVNKNIYTKCTVHSGKLMEFYCKTHDALGCSMCFVTGHRSCADIDSILEKSGSILDSEEYTDFILTLKSLDKKSTDLIEKSRANITLTKTCHSEVIKAVKQFKDKIIENLEKLERELTMESQTLLTDAEQKMSSIAEDCNKTKQKIQTIMTDVEKLRSSRRVCQVYISIKENIEQIKQLQQKLHLADESLFVKEYKFECNKTFHKLITSMHALGEISSEVNTTPLRQQMTRKVSVSVPVTNISIPKPKHVMDIGLRYRGLVPTVTGSVVVSKNRLGIVDNRNLTVKLWDTQANTMISDFNALHNPCDAIVINRNLVAVSQWYGEALCLLSVSDSLTLVKEITLRSKCAGVAFTKDRLIVTNKNPPRLEIVDLHGNVVKIIEKDCDGKQLFTEPLYVCVSKDEECLYVSDIGSNNVISLTLDGVVKSVYSDNELNYPTNLCVDHHGNVYVCSCNGRSVHMLTANLTKIQIILSQADGLDSNVHSVSHCHETNRLYVGMRRRTMKVFQLS